MEKKKAGLFQRIKNAVSPPAAAPAPASIPKYSPSPRVSWPKTTSVFFLGIPTKIGEYKVKYRYDNVEASFISHSYDPGLSLDLQANGDIFAEGIRIGTYSSEKIRKMVSDFSGRGEPFSAKLFRMNEDSTGLIYAVFYKIPNYTAEKVVKVSGTGSERKQDELIYFSPGDELYLEEDMEHEGRVNVSDIGYLGKKDAEWAINELDFDDCEVTVDSIKEDDNFKNVLFVKIRY